MGSEPTNRGKTKHTIKKLMVIYITRTVYFGCLKGRCIDDEENKTVNSNVFSCCVTYGVSYDIKNCIVNVTTIKETGDNEYEVYGKANIIDNYGDKWEASFDGKCTINGEKGRAHNMNYGEPKKQ